MAHPSSVSILATIESALTGQVKALLSFALRQDGIARHAIGIGRQEIELSVTDGDVDSVIDFLGSFRGDGIGGRVKEFPDVLERDLEPLFSSGMLRSMSGYSFPSLVTRLKLVASSEMLR